MSTIQEFDYSVNILRSLLWRNNEAVNIQALMQFKQDAFDELNVQFWTDWYDNVFNLKTANEFGLNVWSIILGVEITIDPEVEPPNSNFGFGPFRKNFNNGNFSANAGDVVLTPDDARLVLRLRYYQLILNGNVLDINKALQDVFGDLGLAYVQDNLDMTMLYVFEFSLTAEVQFILDTTDILPRPTGVDVSYIIIP